MDRSARERWNERYLENGVASIVAQRRRQHAIDGR
jgi:hypothetical protein